MKWHSAKKSEVEVRIVSYIVESMNGSQILWLSTRCMLLPHGARCKHISSNLVNNSIMMPMYAKQNTTTGLKNSGYRHANFDMISAQ